MTGYDTPRPTADEAHDHAEHLAHDLPQSLIVIGGEVS